MFSFIRIINKWFLDLVEDNSVTKVVATFARATVAIGYIDKDDFDYVGGNCWVIDKSYGSGGCTT